MRAALSSTVFVILINGDIASLLLRLAEKANLCMIFCETFYYFPTLAKRAEYFKREEQSKEWPQKTVFMFSVYDTGL